MAGHSQFKNIMHRKGAQDAKRAKIFTKVTREIITAVKTGAPDPNMNPRLRSAIQWARKENLPRDRIEAAIKRGSGDIEGDNFEEMRYEGYGPAGTALIVTALTDNRNRSASDIRSIFSKNGGNMAETGSVSFMFDNIGMISYPLETASEEDMLEAAIEAGADNCECDDSLHTITCSLENFGAVRDSLEKKFESPDTAKLIWQPKNTITVDEDQAQQIIKFIDALEDNDDVQEVFSNFEIPEDVLAKLSA